ncbi:DNA gyrase inhibitor YacG [Parvularcula maris]|uniref:DNA gyrase inhibitor YacG n=1 Tax=Parvularcula maris TaxID=2965077 RepID=A0A9X2LBA9_9PROT|nr:DNA gyrase inhibitor YacG [Parvularcula maris]MCQ8186522.1 DNA gyrase inhibitor YacG [Parvularcula maris]
MTSSANCPICSKRTEADYAPFCSKRCADVDLNRWLSDQYAVPGAEDESADLGDEDQSLRH